MNKGLIAQEIKLELGGWISHYHLHIWKANLCNFFPRRVCVFIFVYKLYLTTIWGCALNSLSCVFYSLLMLCWSHHERALSSLSDESLPSLPRAQVTLPPLFSYSQSTKSALISYTVLLSEVGSIHEEDKDFNVEKTGLISSLTHTIKMSQAYILLESLWNPQTWICNTELITVRQHMKLGDSIFQTILAWKARLSACLALN